MADNKKAIDKNSNKEKSDPNYWKSFEQLYQDEEFIEESHNEFKDGVKDDFDPLKLPDISRRKFLALLGASAALAGAGCADYRDKGDIIPYTNRPEEITLGKPNYYASTARDGSGILIKTREGRPIKIDGNPDHPVTKGKVTAQVQAEILNLYNPERIQSPLRKTGRLSFADTTWEKANTEILKALKNAGSKEIAVISNRIISPTTKKIFDDFKVKYPSAKFYSYELFNDEVKNSAWKKSHGGDFYPFIKWDEAKIILSLESDFLGIDRNRIENARLFAKGRNVDDTEKFNRLYVAEGCLSVTGMNADYRMRIRPDVQYDFVLSLLREFGVGNGTSLNEFGDKYSLNKKTLNYLVDDLRRNRGKAIVTAGNELPENVHIAVNLLNDVIGANSSLYRTDSSPVTLMPLSGINEFAQLSAGMKNGNVAAVIHFDSNPVYQLPPDIGYKEALNKVPLVVSLVECESESSIESNYILPLNHTLESWGDYQTRTGFYSLQQPVISPIFNTKQKEEVLLNWIEDNSNKEKQTTYHQYLINNWQKNIYPGINSLFGFERFWQIALHDGVVRTGEQEVSFGSGDMSLLNTNFDYKYGDSKYVVVLKESYQVGDGRYANNGWLQELPHPVSKITWDNYAAVSLKTANELNINSNDIIEIDVDGRKLEIPAFVQPGAADDTITIELGYGRNFAGIVAKGVGFDANVLMSENPGLSPWLYKVSSINQTGKTYKLVSSQEHHSFDNALTKNAVKDRGIIKEGTIEEYKKEPKFLHYEHEEHELHTFYPERGYPGVKWGMSIDMNKCLGCGDCVVACNAENNIPIVGKDQVEKGREMHWIRIDRYYSGTAEEPNVSNQVMLCQHCDHAPCENVCPVAATTHSPDGLNQMVYNRCVGTRYCSNNCPYKVRRFNFFNFRDHFRDQYQESTLFSMVYNPEVTVRSRGVMEKCTFCIQRIAEEREDAIREGRNVRGTNVKTACQEACPTEAIKFGDINDKDSEFSKYRNHDLGYYVLEETNVRPNVTYIAKLRNTHPEEA